MYAKTGVERFLDPGTLISSSIEQDWHNILVNIESHLMPCNFNLEIVCRAVQKQHTSGNNFICFDVQDYTAFLGSANDALKTF